MPPGKIGRTLKFNGITRTVSQWAVALGIKATTINHRLYGGWSIERTLSTPQKGRLPKASKPDFPIVGCRCSKCLRGIIHTKGVKINHRWSDEHQGYIFKFTCYYCNPDLINDGSV